MSSAPHTAFSCDTCAKPGTCCRDLMLHTVVDGEKRSITFWDDEDLQAQITAHGLPFQGLRKESTTTDEETGRTYSEWHLTCPLLQPNGRCGDYENRPELCRSYQPGQDPMCVYHIRYDPNRLP